MAQIYLKTRKNNMEVPRYWRLRGLDRGPGQFDQEGRIVVNGKIFDPMTRQLLSPIEMALRRPNESSNGNVYVMIAAMADLMNE